MQPQQPQPSPQPHPQYQRPPQRPIYSYVVPSHRAVRGVELLAILGMPLLFGITSAVVFFAALFLTGAQQYEGFSVPISVVCGAGALIATLWFQKWTPADLALNKLRDSAWHLMWQVPAVMVASGIASVASSLLLTAPPTSDSEDLAKDFHLGVPVIVISVLSIAFVGPLIEEILFRRFIMGFLDQVLLRRMEPLAGIVLSTILSSIIFALAHGIPTVMVYTFVLGCGAAFLIRQHQSLWAGVILHCTNNAMVAVVAVSIFLTGS